MDAHTDIHLTRGDIRENTLAESFTVDHEHKPGDTLLNEDSASDNLSLPSSNVHLSLVTGSGDIEAHGGQSPIHSFKSHHQLSDIPTERNSIDHEHSCAASQSNSVQVILPAIPKEVLPSECPVVPVGRSTSLTDIDDSEAHTIVYLQEPLPLRARTLSSATGLRDEREADPEDRLDCIQMLPTGLDHVQGSGLVRLTDEEETREDEDFDHPCEDFLPPLPPSSSPPQLFSSSPYASSQSSVSDVEPSKTVPAIEVEAWASSHDCAHGDNAALAVQDGTRLVSEDLHSHDIADIAASTETDKYCSQMGPTSCTEGGLELSSKRIADSGESYGSQPVKRPKLASRLYLPPAPKRATLTSQHHQFKKLAAPFRPPLKLPIATDGPPQTMNNKVESTIRATLETSHDKIDPKGSIIRLQHKGSNSSRSATQFKSPLVNRDLPADSRTIRLTPALQALERQLQLLKRAIKVKGDNEEEVLIRLAGKWIEAGREVAYDVWDATKDSCDFGAKAKLIRGSHGTNDRNTNWGWDTKPGDASEQSCDPDPSEAPCTARQVTPEEDDDASCHTLGTMLRQLGIAPEIFGWDDDKEIFAD